MNLLKQLNDTMQYIEDNLQETIDLKEVAEKAYHSEYEFKRLFSLLAGMTISEYIRKRRLTLAAMALQKNEDKVIDVAYTYGYSSPDSFTRAFVKFHNVLPSDVKKHSKILKSCPKMTFQLTVQGGQEMNYKIIEKDAFQVVGIKNKMEMVDDELVQGYDVVMDELTEKRQEIFMELSNTDPRGIIHVPVNYSKGTTGADTFDQYIGAAVKNSESNLKEFDQLDVPALTWAVFSVEGEWEEVDAYWTRIYSEWFPSSSYQLAHGPEILASKDNHSELWIPVKKESE